MLNEVSDKIIKYNKMFYKSCYYIFHVNIFARAIFWRKENDGLNRDVYFSKLIE